MSEALHHTFLNWNGTFGRVKHGVVIVDLTQWPSAALPGAHVREIRYIPLIRECEIRMSGQPWRPMLDAERAAVHEWLERKAAETRSIWYD